MVNLVRIINRVARQQRRKVLEPAVRLEQRKTSTTTSSTKRSGGGGGSPSQSQPEPKPEPTQEQIIAKEALAQRSTTSRTAAQAAITPLDPFAIAQSTAKGLAPTQRTRQTIPAQAFQVTTEERTGFGGFGGGSTRGSGAGGVIGEPNLRDKVIGEIESRLSGEKLADSFFKFQAKTGNIGRPILTASDIFNAANINFVIPPFTSTNTPEEQFRQFREGKDFNIPPLVTPEIISPIASESLTTQPTNIEKSVAGKLGAVQALFEKVRDEPTELEGKLLTSFATGFAFAETGKIIFSSLGRAGIISFAAGSAALAGGFAISKDIEFGREITTLEPMPSEDIFARTSKGTFLEQIAEVAAFTGGVEASIGLDRPLGRTRASPKERAGLEERFEIERFREGRLSETILEKPEGVKRISELDILTKREVVRLPEPPKPEPGFDVLFEGRTTRAVPEGAVNVISEGKGRLVVPKPEEPLIPEFFKPFEGAKTEGSIAILERPVKLESFKFEFPREKVIFKQETIPISETFITEGGAKIDITGNVPFLRRSIETPEVRKVTGEFSLNIPSTTPGFVREISIAEFFPVREFKLPPPPKEKPITPGDIGISIRKPTPERFVGPDITSIGVKTPRTILEKIGLKKSRTLREFIEVPQTPKFDTKIEEPKISTPKIEEITQPKRAREKTMEVSEQELVSLLEPPQQIPKTTISSITKVQGTITKEPIISVTKITPEVGFAPPISFSKSISKPALDSTSAIASRLKTILKPVTETMPLTDVTPITDVRPIVGVSSALAAATISSPRQLQLSVPVGKGPEFLITQPRPPKIPGFEFNFRLPEGIRARSFVTKRPTRFQPSLIGVAEMIKIKKKPKSLTGLEIRGVLI